MVTVRVDPDLCVGHGRCYVLADDVFGADEFGHCIVLEEQVSAALEAQARMGAENCPEQAITIS
jgi:ferredoxin